MDCSAVSDIDGEDFERLVAGDRRRGLRNFHGCSTAINMMKGAAAHLLSSGPLSLLHGGNSPSRVCRMKDTTVLACGVRPSYWLTYSA